MSALEELESYALGRSEDETWRLIRQAQIYGPFTRQLFETAGIGPGMSVLDLGSGAGDVALLLADMVGPRGHVLGLDLNPMILDTARARVRAAGWTNVTFLATDIDIRHAVLEERFDAVVGRWFLMHLPDPVELLRRLPHLLRPGGIIAFQESDFTNPPTTFPPTEVHRQVLEWTTPSHGGPGPDLCMGSKLYRAYIEAGLDPPQLRIDAPLGGGPDWPGYAYVADTVKSLLPFLEEVGAVDPGLVDIDTLEDRLRGEVVAVDGIQLLTAVIGAWTRGPRPEPD